MPCSLKHHDCYLFLSDWALHRLVLRVLSVRTTDSAMNSITYDLQVILMLRVWVMYNRDRKMGIFLSALYVVSLIISLILHVKQPLPFVSRVSIAYH